MHHHASLPIPVLLTCASLFALGCSPSNEPSSTASPTSGDASSAAADAGDQPEASTADADADADADAAEPTPGDASGPRPNIVLFVADDLGSGDLSIQGSTAVQTPNIDSIADSGFRFRNAYTTATVCAPSRMGYHTGRYQHRFGAPALGDSLHPDERTYGNRLQDLGYTTIMIGKSHDKLGKETGEWNNHPMNRGFDRYYGFIGANRGHFNSSLLFNDWNQEPPPEGSYLTDNFGDRAVAYIDEYHASDRPFLLYVAYAAVHSPWQAPQELIDKYPGVSPPERQIMLAMVDALDQSVGKVLGRLDHHGIADNTLVVFISDQGGITNDLDGTSGVDINGATVPPKEAVADNGMYRWGKSHKYDGGLRTPLLLRWPARYPTGGRTFDGVCSTLDLTPTFVAAAGGAIDPSWELDGVNLLPFLDGEATGDPHHELFWERKSNFAARVGTWKLVRDAAAVDGPGLFDLASDPGETNNLYEVELGKREELTSALDTWWASVSADAEERGFAPSPPGQ